MAWRTVRTVRTVARTPFCRMEIMRVPCFAFAVEGHFDARLA